MLFNLVLITEWLCGHYTSGKHPVDVDYVVRAHVAHTLFVLTPDHMVRHTFCSQVNVNSSHNYMTLLSCSFPHMCVTGSAYNVRAITELPCRDKLPRALSFPNCFPSSCLSSSGSEVNCVPSDDSFLRLLISLRLHTDHHCSLQPCRQLTSRQNKLYLLC